MRVASVRSPNVARIVAIVLLWISRTLASLLVAIPLVFAIVSTGIASSTERDALLFRRGGLVLLELARAGAPALGSALKNSLVLGALCAVLGLIPLGAALDLLQSQETDAFPARFARAMRVFPGFLALSALTLLAQAALLLGASLLSSALNAALHGHDERLLTCSPFAVFGVALLGCAALGALLDVARGVRVQHELKARAALSEALVILRETPLAVLAGSYASTAGSVFAWLAAASVLSRIDLANPVTRGIALAFVVHQLAVLFSIGMRVRWLGTTLALSAVLPDRETRNDDESAGD